MTKRLTILTLIILMLLNVSSLKAQKLNDIDFLNLFPTIIPENYHLSSATLNTGRYIEVEKFNDLGLKKAIKNLEGIYYSDKNIPKAVGKFDFSVAEKKYVGLVVLFSYQALNAYGLLVWDKANKKALENCYFNLSLNSRNLKQNNAIETIIPKLLNYLFQSNNLSDKTLNLYNRESWITINNTGQINIITREKAKTGVSDAYTSAAESDVATFWEFNGQNFIGGDVEITTMDVYKYPMSAWDVNQKVYTGKILNLNKGNRLGYQMTDPIHDLTFQLKNGDLINIVLEENKQNSTALVFKNNKKVEPSYAYLLKGASISIEGFKSENNDKIFIAKRIDILNVSNTNTDTKLPQKPLTEKPKQTVITDAKAPESQYSPRDELLLKARGDEYMAGYENKGGNTIAKYWKNGAATNLTDGSKNAKALSIFVFGADTYVSGWEENSSSVKVAKYWKNNRPAEDLSTGMYDAVATGIFVDNNKVYATGYTTDAHNIRKAVYWKNGEQTKLSDVSDDAAGNSIYVSNNNVYVAGFEKNSKGIFVAKYWEGSTSIPLSDGSKNTVAGCIYKNNNDIIVAGEEIHSSNKKYSKYWKNRAEFSMDIRQASNINSIPVNIQIKDGIATSVFYANENWNTTKPDITKFIKPIAIENNVKPNIKASEAEKEAEKFKDYQQVMLSFMKRKNINQGDSHYLIGVLVDFYDNRPNFDLYYKRYDGTIEKITLNWHGWGECWLDEVTDECHRTRDFTSADDFKQSVCRKGGIVAIKGNWGVGRFEVKRIHHLN